PAQRLPVERHGFFRCSLRRFTRQHALSPLTELRFDRLPIQLPEDGVQSGRAGRLITSEPESPDQIGPVIAPPLSHRAVAAITAEHRAAGQRQDSAEWMPLSLWRTEIGNFRQHFDQWSDARYHRFTLESVVSGRGVASPLRPETTLFICW